MKTCVLHAWLGYLNLVLLTKHLLHRSQFPSQKGTKDGIEMAYDLVADEASRLLVVNMRTVEQVETAQTAYQAAQTAIMALKSNGAPDMDSVSLILVAYL